MPPIHTGQQEEDRQQAPGPLLPEYICHKVVRAVRIADLEVLSATDGEGDTEPAAVITPADRIFAPFTVSKEYCAKHKPHAGGYFVLYNDGYQSFSPAKAFEDGYKQRDAVNPAPMRPAGWQEDIVTRPHELFRYTSLNEQGVSACTTIALAFTAILGVLERQCYPGREFSLTKTHLEEACMFAKKAVSRDPRYTIHEGGTGIAGAIPMGAEERTKQQRAG